MGEHRWCGKMWTGDDSSIPSQDVVCLLLAALQLDQLLWGRSSYFVNSAILPSPIVVSLLLIVSNLFPTFFICCFWDDWGFLPKKVKVNSRFHFISFLYLFFNSCNTPILQYAGRVTPQIYRRTPLQNSFAKRKIANSSPFLFFLRLTPVQALLPTSRIARGCLMYAAKLYPQVSLSRSLLSEERKKQDTIMFLCRLKYSPSLRSLVSYLRHYYYDS